MYILEGNIGAGKSTFLTMLEKQLSFISPLLEPVNNWQKQIYGQSLLANFYKDPKRWAFTLETLTMMSRVKNHRIEQELPNPYRVMERSIYSGHYCFAKNGYEQKFMTEVEWNIYMDWFNMLIPGKCNPPRGFIYLKVKPEITYERIKKRNRLAEKKITLAYQKQIDKRHDDFLLHKKNLITDLKNIPVLIINCDEEFETNPKKFQEHCARVEEFICQTSINNSKKQPTLQYLQNRELEIR